jgi:glyoxylase-like metal-dependent hydrolase (beta-lactamase superfamily II)
MIIGQATMRPVLEIEEVSVPPQILISDITPADVEPHSHWLCPNFVDTANGNCRLSQHAWLIEANGKRIIVDPCVGHQRNRPLIAFYHMIDSPLLDRLEALGVSPESIDYVFCTHLHLDHVGWNTRLKDGRYIPTFPNARYLFSRAEDDYWKRELTGELPNEEMFNAGVYAECIEPVIEAKLADIVEPGVKVADCLTLIEAAGHTIGHMAGVLESAGEGAVLAGDAFHHPLQVIYPDRHGRCYDPRQAQATRRRLLDICVEKDFWLAPAHFRAPHLCKVRKRSNDYQMEWATARFARMRRNDCGSNITPKSTDRRNVDRTATFGVNAGSSSRSAHLEESQPPRETAPHPSKTADAPDPNSRVRNHKA